MFQPAALTLYGASRTRSLRAAGAVGSGSGEHSVFVEKSMRPNEYLYVTTATIEKSAITILPTNQEGALLRISRGLG